MSQITAERSFNESFQKLLGETEAAKVLEELQPQHKRAIYAAMQKFLSENLEQKITELERQFCVFGEIITKRNIQKAEVSGLSQETQNNKQ